MQIYKNVPQTKGGNKTYTRETSRKRVQQRVFAGLKTT